MTMAMFDALPAYFGGKRRLVTRIFKHLPPPAQAPVLADAFLGGGAVSLFAKARGYRVLCNDIAERSVIVGKALIENDSVRLCDADLVRLFTPIAHEGFCLAHLAPDVVLEVHAQFLDQLMAHARATPGPKGDLLLLLAVKYLLSQRPMGNFGAKSIVHQLGEGDFDAVNPAYLKDAVQRMVLRHPLDVVRKLAGQIHAGLLSNGQRHEAHRGDVLDFVRGCRADILYADFPYPGTLDYAVALRPLDEMLAGTVLQPERSRFSRSDAWAFIEEVLAAATHIPVWAISLGGPVVELPALAELVGRYRSRVHAEAVAYAHLTGLSSAEAKASNRELIVIGWGGRS